MQAVGVHPQGGDDGGGGCKLWVYTHSLGSVVGASGGWWVGVHPQGGGSGGGGCKLWVYTRMVTFCVLDYGL